MKKCEGMSLLTELALMMRVDLLALIFGLRKFVTVVYGPVMTHVSPDVQVEAFRHSVLYVNFVSVVDCSVLNWMLTDLNNSIKCRMGGENLSNVQLGPMTNRQGYEGRSENPGLAEDL